MQRAEEAADCLFVPPHADVGVKEDAKSRTYVNEIAESLSIQMTTEEGSCCRWWLVLYQMNSPVYG
jgi:hypothetical protein